VVLFGPRVQPYLPNVVECVQQVAVKRKQDMICSCSPMGGCGILLRVAAVSTELVTQFLQSVALSRLFEDVGGCPFK